ncbi:MAG: hypothetical protein N3F64_05590 [Nitrososphaeria archaeon]|nr:hypothetical protein [Nitrososphaeria archaeon]
MRYHIFKGEIESVYLLEDKLVVTVAFPDPSVVSVLSNEWIITFERDDIKDVSCNDEYLIILTQDNKEIKLNLYDIKKAYIEIKRWMKK